MKKSKVLLIVLAIMLTCGSLAYAAPAIDVVQAPTGFFVPTDPQKLSAPYYRWYGEDWGWTHGAMASGFSTATLSISAFDVDAPSEVDNIYAYDNGVKTLLGSLAGGNNIWSYTTFTLGSNFYDDIAAGLQVMIEIDTATQGNWAVSLAKSVVSVDGGTPPNPGLPEPATLLLLGLGLAGLATLRKKI
jgi:hypothetical protein